MKKLILFIVVCTFTEFKAFSQEQRVTEQNIDENVKKIYRQYLLDEKNYRPDHKIKELVRRVGVSWEAFKTKMEKTGGSLVLTCPRDSKVIYRYIVLNTSYTVVSIEQTIENKLYRNSKKGKTLIRSTTEGQSLIENLDRIFTDPYPLGGDNADILGFVPIIIEKVDKLGNHKWAIRSNYTPLSSVIKASAVFNHGPDLKLQEVKP